MPQAFLTELYIYSIPCILIWFPKRLTKTLSVLVFILILIFSQDKILFQVSSHDMYINLCFRPFPWINIVCSLKMMSSSDMLAASSILIPELISRSISARFLHAFQYENVEKSFLRCEINGVSVLLILQRIMFLVICVPF